MLSMRLPAVLHRAETCCCLLQCRACAFPRLQLPQLKSSLWGGGATHTQGLVKMRAACKLAAEVLQHAGSLVRPGITTDEIDEAVHDMIVQRGAYPSPLNYGRFPKSVCTSVNEVMCHGIPDKRLVCM